MYENSVLFFLNKYNELHQASVILFYFILLNPKFDLVGGSRTGTLVTTLVYMILAAPVTVAACR